MGPGAAPARDQVNASVFLMAPTVARGYPPWDHGAFLLLYGGHGLVKQCVVGGNSRSLL